MGSVRIGSLFGIPVKLGLSLLVVVPLLAYLVGSEVMALLTLLDWLLGTGIDPGAVTGGWTPWMLGTVAAVSLFASALAHELGHAVVARSFGVDVEGITLWFMGGLANLADLPDDWRKELAIALGGPTVTLGIGLLCYGALVRLPSADPVVRFLLGYLALLNLALVAFNMVPGFPMDGGRVLRALLSRTRTRYEATRIAGTVGKAIAVVFGVVGLVAVNVLWVAVAVFVFVAGASETQQIAVESTYEGVSVAEIMTPAAELDVVVPETRLDDLRDRMVHERHTGYPVLDGDDLVGIVTLEDLEERGPARLERGTVGDIMSTDVVTVSPDTAAKRALRTLQNEEIGRVLVTEGDGTLAGLVSRTDLLTIFSVVDATDAEAAGPRPFDG